MDQQVQPLIGPQALFHSANSFHKSAQLLLEHPDQVLHYWPGSSMEAFSLELMLKCMLEVRGVKQKTHDTLKLFDLLPPDDQREVTRRYDLIISLHHHTLPFLLRGMDFDIREVLTRSSNAFEKIRYCHEGIPPRPDSNGNVSNAGTGSLIDAIRDYLLDLHREWGEVIISIPPMDFANNLPPKSPAD